MQPKRNGAAAIGKLCEPMAQPVECWLLEEVHLSRLTTAVRDLRAQVPSELSNTVPPTWSVSPWQEPLRSVL